MNNYTMKVTILGWWGTFPKPGQACCGVLVQTGQGGILLDCGCGVLSQYFGFAGISDLEGVLLSHLHFDHMSDTGSLFYAVNHALRTGLRTEKLKVFAPASPADIRSIVEYPFAVTSTVEDGTAFSMLGIDITAKRVNHTIECYSYRLEKDGKSLVYFTDSTYLPEAAPWMSGADLLICGTNISEGTRHSVGAGHMTDLQAGETARAIGARELCLIHLPSDGSPQKMRERAAGEFGGDTYTPDIKRIFYL